MSTLLDAALNKTPLPDIFVTRRAPEISNARQVGINIEAEERVLADVDTFTDWLGAKCMGATVEHCRTWYVPRDPARRADYIDALDIPQLVALILHPNTAISGFACRQLRERYMADPQTQAYVSRVGEAVQAEVQR